MQFLQSLLQKVNLYPMWYGLCVITVLIRIFSGWIIYVLNIEIFYGYSLVRFSAACKLLKLKQGQQLGQRLEQINFWPWQYSLWRMTNNQKNMMAQSRYIGFYNLLWLIANDLIIGFAISSMVNGNQSRINDLLNTWINV
jgi:hypothetical protein